MRVANGILARGRQGYPELGLPVFDPLKIASMNVEQLNGPVNVKINMQNIVMRGLSDIRFSKIEGFGRDFDKAKMELRFVFPRLELNGPYKLTGQILILPVNGNGITNMTFTVKLDLCFLKII